MQVLRSKQFFKPAPVKAMMLMTLFSATSTQPRAVMPIKHWRSARFFWEALGAYDYVIKQSKFRFNLHGAIGISIALHACAFALMYSVSDATFQLRLAGDGEARHSIISATITSSAFPLPTASLTDMTSSAKLTAPVSESLTTPQSNSVISHHGADAVQPEKTSLAIPVTAAPSKPAPLPPAPDYHPRSALETTPRLLNEITPVYPENDGLQEGAVVLRILIDERGNVDDVAVVRSIPANIFDASAVAAFQKAQFLPGKYLGVAVKSQLLLEVKFTPYNRGGLVNGRIN